MALSPSVKEGDFGTESPSLAPQNSRMAHVFRSAGPFKSSKSRSEHNETCLKLPNDQPSGPIPLVPADVRGIAAASFMLSSLGTPTEARSGEGATRRALPLAEIRVGRTQKPFFINTDLLTAKSTYFLAMDLNNPSNLQGPFSFPQTDELAFGLFRHWLYGGKLQGPHDFNSMNHYVCLYIIGLTLGVEKLRNKVMDLVRGYYRREQLTSPSYRLEFIYATVPEPCLMKTFLVHTAAYRAMGNHDTAMSDGLKIVLMNGKDLAVDFAEALIALQRNGRVDARKGDDCRWHEHAMSEKCAPRRLEPYESP